jgi:chromosome segregation ATPase
MGDVTQSGALDALAIWLNEGHALAAQIEAERDTVRHRIDRDHAHMITLGEKLREVRGRLGTDRDEARALRMKRAELELALSEARADLADLEARIVDLAARVKAGR